MANIDKLLLQTLRSEVNAALVEIGKKHGLNLQAGAASFTTETACFKLNVTKLTETGAVITKEMADLKLHFKSLGLNESHLDQVFTVQGIAFRLVGFRRSARAKPFLARRVSDGKNFILRDEQLYSALKIGLKDRGIFSDFGADVYNESDIRGADEITD